MARLTIAGRMERSLEAFEQACEVYLAEELDKLAPDSALIALLCDAVRLSRAYAAHVTAQVQ